MSLDIVVQRSGNKLIPASLADEEALNELKQGEQLMARLWKPRSLRHNRWWWALLDIVAENHPIYDTSTKLALYLKVKCGLVDSVVINQETGETAMIVKSTRFLIMGQHEFVDFVNKALDEIHVLWHGSVSRNDLISRTNQRSSISYRELTVT